MPGWRSRLTVATDRLALLALCLILRGTAARIASRNALSAAAEAGHRAAAADPAAADEDGGVARGHAAHHAEQHPQGLVVESRLLPRRVTAHDGALVAADEACACIARSLANCSSEMVERGDLATGTLSPQPARERERPHRLLEAAADRDVAVVGRGLDVDREGALPPPPGRPISAPQLRIPWHLAEALRRCGRLLDHPPQRRRALATGQRRPLVPGQPVATGHALRLCVRPLAATQSDSAPRRPPRLLLAGHFA